MIVASVPETHENGQSLRPDSSRPLFVCNPVAEKVATFSTGAGFGASRIPVPGGLELADVSHVASDFGPPTRLHLASQNLHGHLLLLVVYHIPFTAVARGR